MEEEIYRDKNDNRLFTRDEVTTILRKRIERRLERLFQKYNVNNEDELDELIKKIKPDKTTHDLVKEKTELPSFDRAIGHDKVKTQLKEIVASLKTCISEHKERFFNTVCFIGEPGSGKTFFANLFVRELYANNIILERKPYICYLNTLKEDELSTKFSQNRNGVIVIKDMAEAIEYAPSRFMRELYSEIDRHKDDVIVIFCGVERKLYSAYKKDPYFSSRVSKLVFFNNYTPEDLFTMMVSTAASRLLKFKDNTRPELIRLLNYMIKLPNFAGAIGARNLLEKIIFAQSTRLAFSKRDNVTDIILEDVYSVEKAEGLIRTILKDNEKTYEKQLYELVGLEVVKKEITRMKAYTLKNINKNNNLNMHMCFTGNPGTGKTEVARLLAGILYENGILPENKLVQKDRSQLCGRYIGETAPLVREAVISALGGVLFIDEAYMLDPLDVEKDYGQEAIAELLKCMEDYRGQFVAILAGYKEETLHMIKSNPGMESRINKYIDFPNYTETELVEIAKKMIKDNGYQCSNENVKEIVSAVYQKKDDKNFANARDVRNALESIFEIQAVRTSNNKSYTITKNDVDVYLSENNIKKTDIYVDSISETNDYLDNLSPVSISSLNDMEDRTILITRYKEGTKQGEGTGFLISNNGLVVTNNHVVENADKLILRKTLFLQDGSKVFKEYEAKIYKTNKTKDVALLSITNKDYEFPYFKISKAKPVELTPVMMSGYPFGGSRLNNISFTEGKVQSFNRDLWLTDGKDEVDRIYVDINGVPGNSGGPLINKQTGEVIGIYSGASTLSQSHIVSELNFAVPIQYVLNLLEGAL